MEIVCLDLEGVLVPEIWIEFSRATGIPEFARTTRDEPDYDKLMHYRIDLLAKHGLGLAEIQSVIARIDPMEGAREFLDALRERTQVAILSDTFAEFAKPLMKKLGWPTLLCNTLVATPEGKVTGYKMRCAKSKLATVRAFQSCGLDTIAAGDSFNDLEMIRASRAGFLFRSTDAIKAANPDLPAFETYAELLSAIEESGPVEAQHSRYRSAEIRKGDVRAFFLECDADVENAAERRKHKRYDQGLQKVEVPARKFDAVASEAVRPLGESDAVPTHQWCRVRIEIPQMPRQCQAADVTFAGRFRHPQSKVRLLKLYPIVRVKPVDGQECRARDHEGVRAVGGWEVLVDVRWVLLNRKFVLVAVVALTCPRIVERAERPYSQATIVAPLRGHWRDKRSLGMAGKALDHFGDVVRLKDVVAVEKEQVFSFRDPGAAVPRQSRESVVWRPGVLDAAIVSEVLVQSAADVFGGAVVRHYRLNVRVG